MYYYLLCISFFINFTHHVPAMQAYFGERGRERAHFDQASTILDSNSEEAWGETKMRPREWELE